MWCTVYQLYLDNQRLPAEVVRERGIYGWLYMYSRVPVTGMPFCQAHLLPFQGAPRLQELIKPLRHCHLALIDGGGIRLRGQEWAVDYQNPKQSWWCVPGEKSDASR